MAGAGQGEQAWWRPCRCRKLRLLWSGEGVGGVAGAGGITSDEEWTSEVNRRRGLNDVRIDNGMGETKKVDRIAVVEQGTEWPGRKHDEDDDCTTIDVNVLYPPHTEKRRNDRCF